MNEAMAWRENEPSRKTRPLKMGFVGHCQRLWISETGVVSEHKGLNFMAIILQDTVRYL